MAMVFPRCPCGLRAVEAFVICIHEAARARGISDNPRTDHRRARKRSESVARSVCGCLGAGRRDLRSPSTAEHRDPSPTRNRSRHRQHCMMKSGHAWVFRRTLERFEEPCSEETDCDGYGIVDRWIVTQRIQGPLFAAPAERIRAP
ncbi:uncharacterized protein B0H18DRAFT_993118 [Fomitopsis serialis]|uniref:uncharacterized protein n=1 Tax=Fomitopsis serialis TaxID=139415 RepID=UPI002007B962|nr:uncharacterized protein B0H18DRAFT_993118 [Neoantrodia serialis]KAH9930697.1 hypothetical protein B0H18DRAFT_993118 [Neoantrodia serialis]